jgi:hypothetical protein
MFMVVSFLDGGDRRGVPCPTWTGAPVSRPFKAPLDDQFILRGRFNFHRPYQDRKNAQDARGGTIGYRVG